ncbi:heme-degrading monooxygenase HmoA [Geodermatophilus sabuli]|uniref:Cyclase n=2 Tax=Geodermatophilus sabuli TaxID=1564158 RepID=A0A285EAM9_9ACTN|nr:hypothetical protein [Geodermatophilus sabuli]MBB3085481.1 heme-degrading monooxygenase HmoA [Geodermatophilus sabuli]SNX96095.1 hypothetical protein SAMN06893097_103264 [Geodermatophilus sabuli]
MVYLVSIFPVPDYDLWQTELARGTERRRRHGVTRHWVYRGSDDPNEVMMVMELASLEDAKAFLASPEAGTRAWMDRIGMEIYPTFFVGERIEEADYEDTHDPAQRA